MVFNHLMESDFLLTWTCFINSIGDTLKKHYPGTDAWFITSNMEALKHVGLRPHGKLNYLMDILRVGL